MQRMKQDGSGWEDCGEAVAPKSNLGTYHRYNRRLSAELERITKTIKKMNKHRSERYVRGIKLHQYQAKDLREFKKKS